MNTAHTLRPDFHLVAIPHNMRDWNIPDYIAYIEGIETVWFFDRNVHVYACEIPPSYELWPLYTSVIFKDSFDQEANEELRDEIEEEVRRWSADEVEYRHVSPFDRFLLKEGTRWLQVGDYREGLSYEDTPYEEQRDEAIEYYQANQQL